MGARDPRRCRPSRDRGRRPRPHSPGRRRWRWPRTPSRPPSWSPCSSPPRARPHRRLRHRPRHRSPSWSPPRPSSRPTCRPRAVAASCRSARLLAGVGVARKLAARRWSPPTIAKNWYGGSLVHCEAGRTRDLATRRAFLHPRRRPDRRVRRDGELSRSAEGRDDGRHPAAHCAARGRPGPSGAAVFVAPTRGGATANGAWPMSRRVACVRESGPPRRCRAAPRLQRDPRDVGAATQRAGRR